MFCISGGIGIILLIAVAVVYSRLPLTLREARLLLRKIFIIIVSFLVFFIIVLLTLSMRVITATTKVYQLPTLWLVVAVAFPIGLLLFPIAFLFSFYKSFKLCSQKICYGVCKRHKPGQIKPRVHFHEPTDVPTVPVSSRVSPPSITLPFPVPYTNEFTHITTATTLHISERCNDTKYGSAFGL